MEMDAIAAHGIEERESSHFHRNIRIIQQRNIAQER